MASTDILVIFNPAAARGRSGMRLRKACSLLGRAEFVATTAPGHATELAAAAASAGIPTVVAAGGDGTVHEVANGLLRHPAAPSAFAVLPLGSGNDYASALQLPRRLEHICNVVQNGRIRTVDVGHVRDDAGRERFFVNTIGLGLSGAVTWESRQINGLRGLALYGLAALRAIWKHFQPLSTVLTVDGQRWETPTLYLSVALGCREGGGFIIAPDALLDDGWFDYLHAGQMTRWHALGYIPRLAAGRIPANDATIRQGRCRSVDVHSEEPMIVHTDGELYARPGDATRALSIQIKPGLLKVRSVC